MKLVEALTKNKDKTLWENEWIAVKEKDGWYTYTHSVKSNGEAVAVLGYAKDEGVLRYVLGRYENTPCHSDGIVLASLTGMMDKNDESALSVAVRELEEEAGIEKSSKDFVSLGEVRPSKSSDTVIHLFAVELEYDSKKFVGKGDGTKGEEGSYCKFVSFKEAANSKDPILATMAFKLLLGETK